MSCECDSTPVPLSTTPTVSEPTLGGAIGATTQRTCSAKNSEPTRSQLTAISFVATDFIVNGCGAWNCGAAAPVMAMVMTAVPAGAAAVNRTASGAVLPAAKLRLAADSHPPAPTASATTSGPPTGAASGATLHSADWPKKILAPAAGAQLTLRLAVGSVVKASAAGGVNCAASAPPSASATLTAPDGAAAV